MLTPTVIQFKWAEPRQALHRAAGVILE